MLNNNNHNSTSCAFAAQIVSYLYDEAGAKEKIEFQTHLSKCAICADEVSGFAFVRTSISEWRSEEIFALEMPALEIPALNTVNKKAIDSSESGSWLAGLRQLFSHSPKMALGSAVFAVLAVCVGLTLVILNYSVSETVVENENPNAGDVVASNQNKSKNVEIIPMPQDEKLPNAVNPDSQMPETANSQSNDKLRPSKKDSAVKVSNDSPKHKLSIPKSNNALAENNKSNGNKKNKTNNIQKQEVPKLFDFDEDEDKSLRLTDLFAEIDTK